MLATPERQTRYNAAPTIYLPILKTEIKKQSVLYYGASLWNALPLEIRLSDNIDDFKKKLYTIVRN